MDVVVGSLISVESLQAQAKRMIWWSVSTKSPTGGNAKTQDSCLPKAAPHSRHIYILYTIDIYRYQAVGGDCGFVSTFNSMITISRHLERGTCSPKDRLQKSPCNWPSVNEAKAKGASFVGVTGKQKGHQQHWKQLTWQSLVKDVKSQVMGIKNVD